MDDVDIVDGAGSEAQPASLRHFRSSSIIGSNRPALSTMGSASCSDNSVGPDERSLAASTTGRNKDDEIMSERKQSSHIIPSNTEGQGPAPAPAPGTGQTSNIDCLADNFTRIFCPFDDHAEEPTKTGSASSMQCSPSPQGCHDAASEAVQVDTSCASLQLDNILSNPGSEMLASLQSWLVPETYGIQKRMRHRRNRASAPKMKAAHIRQLWNKWHPHNPIPLSQTRSIMDPCPSSNSRRPFDDAYDLYYDSDPGVDHKREQGSTKVKKEALSSRKKKARAHYKSQRPSHIKTSFSYDASSTDAFERLKAPRRKSLDTPHSEPLLDASHEDEQRTYLHPSTPRHTDGNSQFFDSPRSLSEYDLMCPSSDDEVKKFVQEVTNGSMKLIWHREPSETDGEGNSQLQTQPPPISVTSWFEVGAHLDNLVVQPKFIWSPTYEPNLKSRKVHLSCAEPHALELLSIIRVISPTELDRTLYPYARLDRTCCVTTNDNKCHVFEAATPAERDWLVNALKMLVARLASIIIVRDELMLLEFFSPYAGLASLADDESHVEGAIKETHHEVDPSGTFPSPSCQSRPVETKPVDCSTPMFMSTNESDRASLWGQC